MRQGLCVFPSENDPCLAAALPDVEDEIAILAALPIDRELMVNRVIGSEAEVILFLLLLLQLLLVV